jgi:hypothetical protein
LRGLGPPVAAEPVGWLGFGFWWRVVRGGDGGAGGIEVGDGLCSVFLEPSELGIAGCAENAADEASCVAMVQAGFIPDVPLADSAVAVLRLEELGSDRFPVFGHWRDWVSGAAGGHLTRNPSSATEYTPIPIYRHIITLYHLNTLCHSNTAYCRVLTR